jgi:hypothetical protein
LASPDEQIPARARLWPKDWARFRQSAAIWVRLKAGRLPGVAWHSYLLPKLALGICFLGLFAAVLFAVRLSLGPIPINSFAPRIASAIGERFGVGYEISIGGIAIALDGAVPVLSIDELAVNDSSGKKIFTAPRAEVSVGPLALIAGRVSLKRLEIYDVELRLALLPNGSLALPQSPGLNEPADFNPPLNPAGMPDNTLPQPPGDSEPPQDRPREPHCGDDAACHRPADKSGKSYGCDSSHWYQAGQDHYRR